MRNQNDTVSTRVEGEVVLVKAVLMFQIATPQINTTQQPHVGLRHGGYKPPGNSRLLLLPTVIKCVEGKR
jgi:hypothetical protein